MFKKLSNRGDSPVDERDFRSALPTLEECTYTSCFCEENIWHLCKHILQNNKNKIECYCVFISNGIRAIHLWKQKLCHTDEECVVWDYHVIAVFGNTKHGYYVLDLDTALPFPVSFKQYAAEALKSEESIMPTHKRFFRVIPADEYVKHFSSDRRHMKIGDNWQKSPPNYPPIISDTRNPHKLSEFIDMTKGKGYGKVLNYDEFVKKFG